MLVLTLLACDDGKTPDTADSGDTGEVPYDAWDWCPPSTEAVTSGDTTLTVTDEALYCVLAAGSDMQDELAKHLQVRLVPGTYALPSEDTEGVDYALPVCLMGADSAIPSAMDGTGTLVKQTSDFPYHSWYLVGQPLTRDGVAWTFGFSLTAYPRDAGMPDLVFDDALVHGDYPDTEAWIDICDGDCGAYPRRAYPCEAVSPTDTPTLTVTFDRGELSVWVEVVYGTWGPSVPAVFYRAEGTLDGVAFAETDYWRLAHLPDHHNRGGGFLVLFPEPIAGACGLVAEVPSEDGSDHFDELRTATVDCDGATIEELTGTAVE